MILKCIKRNDWPNGKITIGKLYEFDLISEEQEDNDVMVGSTSSYYIKGDDDVYRYYLKEWFVNIQDERNDKLNRLGI